MLNIIYIACMFFFFFKRRVRDGSRGAEEERESQAGSTASAKPHRGLSSHNPEIMT